MVGCLCGEFCGLQAGEAFAFVQPDGVAGLSCADDVDGLVRVTLCQFGFGDYCAAGAVRDEGAVIKLERGSVISFCMWALGLSAPLWWFFTATSAICASVVPYSCMCAVAMRAYKPGKVMPCHCSNG